MKKYSEMLTVLLFCILLFGFAVAFWILPDRTYSEQENRPLRTLPVFDVDRLFSGRYAEQFESYVADQFPLRDQLVGGKCRVELLLGKGENNGILLGRDGQLARRLFSLQRADGSSIGEGDIPDRDLLLSAAEGIDRAASGSKVPFSVLLTGRNLDIAAQAFDYPASVGERMRELLYGSISQDVCAIDTVPMLRAAYESGEYVYYKTDHHWTSLGAYRAYEALLRAWGMEDEILPPEAFERVTVARDFYGTLCAAGGMTDSSPDRVELWLYGNEDSFTVTADGQPLDGFYSYSHLEKKDKYAVFLDGVHDVITVEKRGEERPTLVLFKDSFANSLAPFLAQHFDLVLFNLSSTRTDFTDTGAYAARYGADRVLLIYTLENIMTTDRAGLLR